IFNDYYLGYTIPQISKEFDLLRFGKNYNVNIELKSINVSDKIQKQLLQNRYYLSFLGIETFSFTYVSGENKLFSIDANNNLIEINFAELIGVLKGQEIIEISDLNNLFIPSNYLVSPFNSTKEFIEGKYFLT